MKFWKEVITEDHMTDIRKIRTKINRLTGDKRKYEL